ncbi:HEAT repeat domain-containing protein [Allosphingosinicella deserti]|uniref:HEAT repeat domain-containing protein n=1 Tax=Allosphingosinicella deserti TaxID=2116704 RepID=A0A2P7QRA5_9SPHN|nr:HEAT repeat domain-containing protein [Sphingomonas deserti]PSJ40503.1 hypothetical protein C7I55_09215 [Sphingomonas deserti]
MVLTLSSHAATSIPLEEYVDICDSIANLRDREQALATADALKALSNNKTFLVDFLNTEMKSIAGFQAGNDFKPPTFILHRGAGYAVRAVVWLPAAEADNPALFSYYETHDHNFDFLTCGYYGPGYRTRIYEYDHGRVAGYPGEPVDLRFIEETMLPEGKLMYYLASRDVHTQLPPDALSVSLNLILPRERQDRLTQYEFDATARTVQGSFADMRMRRTIFAALKHIGDDNSLDLVATIAGKHHDHRTRALAWDTLIAMAPGDRAALVEKAMDDPSRYVREVVRRGLR